MFKLLVTGQDGTFYVTAYEVDRITQWGGGKSAAVIVSWTTCTLLVGTFNETADESGAQLTAHWECV